MSRNRTCSCLEGVKGAVCSHSFIRAGGGKRVGRNRTFRTPRVVRAERYRPTQARSPIDLHRHVPWSSPRHGAVERVKSGNGSPSTTSKRGAR